MTRDNPMNGGDPMNRSTTAALCGAKARSGAPCRAPAMRDRRRCHKHGGATPRGLASPHFQHGRYSKAIPPLARRIEEAADDPDYLELRQDIALLDARLGEVLEKVDAGEHGSLWTRVVRRRDAYRRARGTGAEAAAWAALDAAIETGADDWQAWDAVLDLLERRSRLVATELKRIRAEQTHLNVNEAMTLVTRMCEAVKRHVHDDATLSAVAREFEALCRL